MIRMQVILLASYFLKGLMKKDKTGIISLISLTCMYLIIRYPLFSLHGMKDWPFILFCTNAVIIVIASRIFHKQKLPIFVTSAYAISFVIGYLFQFDYGHGLNSMWIIWTISNFIIIIIGCIYEKVRKDERQSNDRRYCSKDRHQ